jgi:hypothetical protein
MQPSVTWAHHREIFHCARCELAHPYRHEEHEHIELTNITTLTPPFSFFGRCCILGVILANQLLTRRQDVRVRVLIALTREKINTAFMMVVSGVGQLGLMIVQQDVRRPNMRLILIFWPHNDT